MQWDGGWEASRWKYEEGHFFQVSESALRCSELRTVRGQKLLDEVKKGDRGNDAQEVIMYVAGFWL